mmetsp:Transcript_18116/g.54548  ORF Transcript_18116/g.54548 Transcript_18116/m.54548 type:complete len:323 (-) Transcript_18116:3370-4338(-)
MNRFLKMSASQGPASCPLSLQMLLSEIAWAANRGQHTLQGGHDLWEAGARCCCRRPACLHERCERGWRSPRNLRTQTTVHDCHGGLHPIKAGKGKRPTGSLPQHDAEAEDVCFFGALLVGEHLWCCPREGADYGHLRDVVAVADDLGQPHVRQLGHPMAGEQDVGALEVHVHDAFGMEEVKASQHINGDALPPHGPCDLLPGDGLEQVTSVHELGDEKHLVVFYTRTLELHDVAVVQGLEQCHLPGKFFAAGVALVPQHLDGHRIDALQHRLVHLPECTAAELPLTTIVPPGHLDVSGIDVPVVPLHVGDSGGGAIGPRALP